ncbi:MAG: hypothetical protein ACJAVI_000985 [Candidatus Azotimanducaceae bacterium]|jgi:hypothetical protein
MLTTPASSKVHQTKNYVYFSNACFANLDFNKTAGKSIGALMFSLTKNIMASNNPLRRPLCRTPHAENASFYISSAFSGTIRRAAVS